MAVYFVILLTRSLQKLTNCKRTRGRNRCANESKDSQCCPIALYGLCVTQTLRLGSQLVKPCKRTWRTPQECHVL